MSRVLNGGVEPSGYVEGTIDRLGYNELQKIIVEANEAVDAAEEAAAEATEAANKVESYFSLGVGEPIKGNASGALIQMSDVSPVDHTLKVKLKAAIGTALLPNLKTYGKNLFDPAVLISEGAKEQPDGSWKFETCSKNNTAVYYGDGYPGRVTISYKVKMADASGSGQRFRVFYKGDTKSYPIGAIPCDGKFAEFSITTQQGRAVDRIELDYGSDKVSTWFKDIQFEFGTEQTPYEPYCGAEYTPNADGTVDDVKSIYPTMTLKTNSDYVIIDAEYNRDLNKAYDAVVNAIKAMGGSVESFVTEIPVADKVFTIHIGSYQSDLKADIALHINGVQVYQSNGYHEVVTFQYDKIPDSASITLHSLSAGYARVGSSWEDYTELDSDLVTDFDLLALGYTEIYISNSY
jgi:hypothetical protein